MSEIELGDKADPRDKVSPRSLVAGSLPWFLSNTTRTDPLVIIERSQYEKTTIAIAVKAVKKRFPDAKFSVTACTGHRKDLRSPPFRLYLIERRDNCAIRDIPDNGERGSLQWQLSLLKINDPLAVIQRDNTHYQKLVRTTKPLRQLDKYTEYLISPCTGIRNDLQDLPFTFFLIERVKLRHPPITIE